MSKRTFKLRGVLAKIVGHDTVVLDVNSIKDAVKAMAVLFPQIKTEWPSVQFQGFGTVESLHTSLAGKDDINVFPAFMVGKKGGFLQVIVGVAIVAGVIALTAATGGLGAGALTIGIGSASVSASSIALFGAITAIGGLMQLMAPTPSIDNGPANTDPEASKYIAATQNTVASGTRIAKSYGTVPIYGHYLSFNIDSKDTATATASGDGSGGSIGPGVFGNVTIL